MQRTETYQDVFLNQARRERTPLTVFLVNGFQMRGVITGFDPFATALAFYSYAVQYETHLFKPQRRQVTDTRTDRTRLLCNDT